MTVHSFPIAPDDSSEWFMTVRGRASVLCLAGHTDAPGVPWPCTAHLFEARRMLAEEGRT